MPARRDSRFGRGKKDSGDRASRPGPPKPNSIRSVPTLPQAVSRNGGKRARQEVRVSPTAPHGGQRRRREPDRPQSLRQRHKERDRRSPRRQLIPAFQLTAVGI